jgi:hypothetical protein
VCAHGGARQMPTLEPTSEGSGAPDADGVLDRVGPHKGHHPRRLAKKPQGGAEVRKGQDLGMGATENRRRSCLLWFCAVSTRTCMRRFFSTAFPPLALLLVLGCPGVYRRADGEANDGEGAEPRLRPTVHPL